MPAPTLFTIEHSTGSELVQMSAFTRKGFGTVSSRGQHMGEPYSGAKAPTVAEGLAVATWKVTVKDSSSQLLIEGPPFPVSELGNVGDDFRIAVFADDVLLGWSGGSYSWKNMKDEENLGTMTLKVLTAPGELKEGTHTLVVKVAASGGKRDIYQFNNR